jgi:hypothetical protein
MAEDKGFFVILTRVGKYNAPVKHWRADLLHAVKDWEKTEAETMEDAIEGQRSQYGLRAEKKMALPALEGIGALPIASGQTIRFISVAEGQPVPAGKA